MTRDEHALHLGGLLGNFHSLEFLLRVFLSKLPGAQPIGVPPGTDIYLSPIGTLLPVSDVTSYDSLGQLLQKFNTQMQLQGRTELDVTLVDLRDALAHGRASAAMVEDSLRVVKFDKPQAGSVRVAFNAIMSEQWFVEQKKRVYEALQRVYAEAKP